MRLTVYSCTATRTDEARSDPATFMCGLHPARRLRAGICAGLLVVALASVAGLGALVNSILSYAFGVVVACGTVGCCIHLLCRAQSEAEPKREALE